MLDFTLSLHRAVAPDPGEQVCWSPFSVASALGLLALGARGPSQDELTAVLGDLDALTSAIAGASRLAPSDDEDAPVLAVSNTLWADDTITIHRSFAELLAGWSDGSVRSAPFRTEPEKARDMINEDVAETTRQLIPELLAPGTIRRDTVSSLVNALYLKSAWRYPFEEGGTSERPFTTAGGPVDVPMMMLNERVGYAARDGWQVVSLPGKGGVEAVVLLPDGELADAEAALTGQSLGTLLDAPDPTQVQLSLPRMKVKTQAELSDALQALGVRTVFTREADLGGISPDWLAVQSVIHESVLKVDEQGFEGAAATAVMLRLMSLPPEPVVVTADRPFLFVVRHKETGVVYFVARVTDPS
ncbi:serpin family protein [Actinokineospora fastidiosa]|uniref:Serine protease n=1 Tax=Actinokineospora fastidiosa TaxID=1816 RepID=A0A918LFR4_9PSEU|nr:serpin family protein [Actinokineospora fastidiosa]GGS41294.1 serine protease [Actinokineospora fastidiosa]